MWWLKGYEYMLGPTPGIEPPLKPKYMDILKRRIRAKNAGTPETDTSTRCLPHGMPRLMESPYPIEIVQTPTASPSCTKWPTTSAASTSARSTRRT